MSTDPGPATHLSIGEVLSFLQEEFPDVTISKIRFLESQGLIQPDRTASGYRKFYESDIERLQWILRQQRDHFLPLKVIRKMLDEGVDRFDPGGGEQPTLWTPTDDDDDGVREPEPATVGAGAPRSAAHPAVASSTAGPARASRAAAPRTTTATTNSTNAASTADRTSAPADAPAASASASQKGPGGNARRPVTEPSSTERAGAGRSPEGASGTSAGGRSGGGGGGGRSPASDEPTAAATRRRGTGDATGGGTEGGGAADRPTLETPADVVAALQEDPRGARRRAGSGGGGEVPGAARPPTERRTRPPTDPATQVTAAELCEATGIDDVLLTGLEQYGLVVAQHRGGELVYGADAVDVARLAARYAELGVEPRHLRMYLVSAEREAGFVEQLAVPLLKQRNPLARGQAGDLAAELRAMGADLHATLLRRELGPDLGA